MFLKELNKLAENVKNGFFLLAGEEDYLIDLFLQKVQEKYDQVNVSTFREKMKIQDIVDVCDTVPFFSQNKLVIVKDSVDDEQKLADYIQDIPSFTCLIYVKKDIDKRTGFYKAAKKYGVIYEFNKLKAYELERWLVDYAREKNIRLEERAASYLTQMVSDLRDGVNCIDVLVSYVYPGKEIGLQNVKDFYGRLIDDNIFDFIDSVQAGSGGSIKNLNDLIVKGVNPLYILSMLEWQYRLLIKARLLLNQSVQNVPERLGVHRYAAEKIVNIAKKHKMDYFVRGMRLCLEAEQDIKTGAIKDELAIEMLAARLVSAQK